MDLNFLYDFLYLRLLILKCITVIFFYCIGVLIFYSYLVEFERYVYIYNLFKLVNLCSNRSVCNYLICLFLLFYEF